MQTVDERVQCIVFRDSTDETTFAIVSCRRHPSLTSGNALRNAITRAVTEWVVTGEGRPMWDYSSGDFNIGDLSTCDYAGGTLGKLLEKHGVVELDIEVFSREGAEKNWSYDTVLCEDEE